MSRTVKAMVYYDQKGEIELSELIDAAYERAYQEQRAREATLWDRRNNGSEKPAATP
jgi:hypothetical protein